MALADVVFGLQTYTDYISGQEQIKGFESALRGQRKGLEKAIQGQSVRVSLNQDAYRAALESGFGALGDSMMFGFGRLDTGIERLTDTVEFGFGELAAGIDKLNADFNLLMGDVIWKLEMQNDLLTSILQTLQPRGSPKTGHTWSPQNRPMRSSR